VLGEEGPKKFCFHQDPRLPWFLMECVTTSGGPLEIREGQRRNAEAVSATRKSGEGVGYTNLVSASEAVEVRVNSLAFYCRIRDVLL
jgi:hypothetical protein